jgi:hypothetical protein
MILYHGSNIEIDKIDLRKCRPYKDFGRGFYTTSIKEQAWSMARRTARTYGDAPCITEFSFNETVLTDPSIKTRSFNNPDKEWALFVINNRNKRFGNIADPECNTDNKYDIVSGPVANDDLVALFDLFAAGTLSAEALAIEMTYRKLTNQISFHTDRVIRHLEKAGVYHG